MADYRTEGGRELTYGIKQGTPEQPLITIITSTFNAARDLHWTIESIRSQTYPNIQWIIADGASQDDTVDILKANEDVIDYWFSEPDSGIYDAWNKAIPYIKGEWVQFLGAGDELYCTTTYEAVTDVLKFVEIDTLLIYGNTHLIDSSRHEIQKIKRPWTEIKGTWCGFLPTLPMHPEVFHRQIIFHSETFDSQNYKIAADALLLLNVIESCEPIYFDVPVVKMLEGGVSSNINTMIRALEETRKIFAYKKYKIPFKHLYKEKIKLICKKILINIFPQIGVCFIFSCFRALKYRNIKWIYRK
ncbi:glycosyltransferase family 2 protein [Vibrio mangrovi]|uniref:Glycosyltransferase family 2 protein n=1 Tax=Vibrio mangrovi TaxID=474394 RepID=A0A1Y6IV07_9VIBR|nr:glycosyltransferase family 2 protein [Vibrio mangrovi]MDW6002162.1 glycosyltransferase family 2 protein [Vibrio mangrovi]SMS01507.1 PGL/p-HBAD biosynthesis glycosyltransferase/MT3031 [Vibrio mangrovi]